MMRADKVRYRQTELQRISHTKKTSVISSRQKDSIASSTPSINKLARTYHLRCLFGKEDNNLLKGEPFLNS